MPAWLIVVVVIVVLVLLVAGILVMTGKHRTERRRKRAEELRNEATAHASVLPETQREAEDLRAKADLAKSEARRAEQRASNAEQGHRIEQATYEDRLREADRLDPEVDHKSSDYQPDVWNDDRSVTSGDTPTTTRADASAAATPPAAEPGADPIPGTASSDEISVAQRTGDPEAEAAASSAQTPTHRRTED